MLLIEVEFGGVCIYGGVVVEVNVHFRLKKFTVLLAARLSFDACSRGDLLKVEDIVDLFKGNFLQPANLYLLTN